MIGPRLRRPARSAIRRLGLLLVGTTVALVATAGPASAHNVLRGTSPGAGATLDQAPAEVVLTFDNPAIALGTRISVTGPDGPVQQGPTRLVDNTVAQSLAGDAPAGSYTVDWRVTSIDGHPISGSYTFTTRSTSPARPGPSEPPGPAPDATPRVSSPILIGVSVLIVANLGLLTWWLFRRRARLDQAHSTTNPVQTD